jgi:uncharacterized protein (UPF0248 family)
MKEKNDAEQNHVLHGLHLIVNETSYKWEHQYITGAQVRELSNIPKEDKLFLAIKRPWEDEPITDETKIDLARPGIERFYSKPQDDYQPVVIIVNGRQKNWNERKISYEQIAKLAFDNYVENDTTVYTVTYTNGPKQNEEGSMVKGDKVFVTNQMIFNVTPTNRS